VAGALFSEYQRLAAHFGQPLAFLRRQADQKRKYGVVGYDGHQHGRFRSSVDCRSPPLSVSRGLSLLVAHVSSILKTTQRLLKICLLKGNSSVICGVMQQPYSRTHLQLSTLGNLFADTANLRPKSYRVFAVFNYFPLIRLTAALWLWHALVLSGDAQGTSAYAFSGGNLTTASGGLPIGPTLGFTFTVGNTPITVTGLGAWDGTIPGLLVTNTVTIYSSTGTPLASVVIPPGTGTTLDAGFRYRALITPLSLSANTPYVLADAYAAIGEELVNGFHGLPVITSAPEITYGQPRASFGGFPTTDSPGLGPYIGPNFTFSVPEPSTLSFTLLGLVAFPGRKLLRYARNISTAIPRHQTPNR
jgi:hypothetical protein